MDELEEEEAPPFFLCPISMELMHHPVTISTGVTYDRKNIEKWLFTYKKLTCPATMQPLNSFILTPNTTLFNLIQSWILHQKHPKPIISPDIDKLRSLLTTINSSPFKVTSLKNLQSLIQTNQQAQNLFLSLGGIQILSKIIGQIAVDHCTADFTAFRACEESLAILHYLPLSDKSSVELLSNPEYLNPMMTVLQRGSAAARLHAVTVLRKLLQTSKDWMELINQEMVTKSLLELLSDEISAKLSSASLDFLTEIMSRSTASNFKNNNRQKAIEAGAICVLVELLPDSNRHKCEKILYLLLRLCECAEGRLAFTEHRLGVAVVSKKILRVSEVATKLGVKILWLVCSFASTKESKVVEDMMMFGCVMKLIVLLHADGRSTTKERVVKMLKMHGGVWRQYACFPTEFKDCLKLMRH